MAIHWRLLPPATRECNKVEREQARSSLGNTPDEKKLSFYAHTCTQDNVAGAQTRDAFYVFFFFALTASPAFTNFDNLNAMSTAINRGINKKGI